MNSQERVCSKCKVNKSIDQYHKKGDRRSAQCKACISKSKKKYRRNLKEKKKRGERNKRRRMKEPATFSPILYGELCEESKAEFVDILSNYLEMAA